MKIIFYCFLQGRPGSNELIQFFVYLIKSLFLFCFEERNIKVWYAKLVVFFLSFNSLNISVHFLVAFVVLMRSRLSLLFSYIYLRFLCLIFFSRFPLYLVFCNLSMWIGVVFCLFVVGYLFLMFSEHPGSMTYYLSLMLESTQPLLPAVITTMLLLYLSLSLSLLFFFLVFQLCICYTFWSCLQVIYSFVIVEKLFFFSLHFCLGSFYWPYLQLNWYFPQPH